MKKRTYTGQETRFIVVCSSHTKRNCKSMEDEDVSISSLHLYRDLNHSGLKMKLLLTFEACVFV